VRKQAWSMPYVFWTYTGGKGRQTGQLVDVNGDGCRTSCARSTRVRI
jgi:hypothetical protein